MPGSDVVAAQMPPSAAHSGPAAGLCGIDGTLGGRPVLQQVQRGPALAGKRLDTLRAELALAGIAVELSRNEAGAQTLIVTAGAWTREVLPDQLDTALAEYRAVRGAEGAR